MNWITDHIAIGNYLNANDAGLLQQQGIASILCLDGCLKGRPPESLGVRAIRVMPLHDGAGNAPDRFLQIVQALARLVATHPPVLVQCHAGRSRSVVVVAGYLMTLRGLQPDEALRWVAAKREAEVTAGLEALLWHL